MAQICQGISCFFDSATLSAFSSLVTAFATIALFIVTSVLARETRSLSKASSQAQITATIEPNAWGVMYVDLVVANSGNAPAYSIKIEFDPPLPRSEDYRTNLPTPLQNVSILRPDQLLQSGLCKFSDVSKKTFSVSISWLPHPRAEKRECVQYLLSMLDYEGVSYLGARSPMVQLADQVKKLREDWRSVSKGQRRLKADTFSSSDRKEEASLREEWVRNVNLEDPPSDANSD
ncbi:hypothetical protein ACCS67_11705 [Rhizobium brockwellii]|uniref:hypothetical protein n=1 Tax=Rhizobium brockwellii TaxID=3019932 RepID=UPI003F943358